MVDIDSILWQQVQCSTNWTNKSTGSWSYSVTVNVVKFFVQACTCNKNLNQANNDLNLNEKNFNLLHYNNWGRL